MKTSSKNCENHTSSRQFRESRRYAEVFHGENFDHRLNQGKFKERFVKRFQIRGASQLDKIHSGFL